MAKFSDIKIIKSKSARKPSPIKSEEPTHLDKKVEKRIERNIKELHYNPKKNNIVQEEPKNRNRNIWLVVIFAILMLGLSISPIFSKANVTVYPKTKQIEYNSAVFSAMKLAPIGSLPFEIMAINGKEEIRVDNAVEKQIESKSKGTVIMYNDWSTSPQKLATNTRLLGNNGKIYKTDKQITIPGKKDNTPGSIEVNVTADKSGEAYNSEPLDFTVVGFAKTAKEQKIYGRSKTSLSGGASGMTYDLSEEDKKKISDEILPKLKSRLISQAHTQTPEGYILYIDAIIFTPDIELEMIQDESNRKVIVQKADLYAFLLNEELLTQQIVKREIKDDSSVSISGLREMKFNFENSNIEDPTTLEQLAFNLTGKATMIWKIDEEAIKKDLRGRPKADIDIVLDNHPEAEDIKARLKPFWRNSFPADIDKIRLTVATVE